MENSMMPEGIDEVLLNKIADSLEEKRQDLGDTLVGVLRVAKSTLTRKIPPMRSSSVKHSRSLVSNPRRLQER